MKSHPGQLQLDFRIPAKDPLTVSEVAQALWTSERMTNGQIFQLIEDGRLGAIDVSRDGTDRSEYRVPLTNLIQYLNGKYGDALYWKFPEHDRLNVRQVAKNLGVSHETVHRYIRDGEFPHAYNVGRVGSAAKEYRIPIVDVVAFVNRRRVGSYC